MEPTENLLDAHWSTLVQSWRKISEEEHLARLSQLTISATYNSTKIENDAITLHDTTEILSRGDVVNFTGDLRAIHEIDNHGRAWRRAIEMAAEGPRAFSLDGLLGLHRILTEHTYDAQRWDAGERPGAFKVHDYGVGPDASVGYPPELCEEAVRSLLDDVGPYLDGGTLAPKKALTVATYLHAWLVEIHPFADGNGRCARLMQNLALMLMACPPIVQRQEDRMAYFGALDAFHESADLQPLLQFNEAEAVLTWKDDV